MSTRDLSDLIHPSWASALEPVAGMITAMGDFLRAEVREGRGYLPDGENILRAFTIPVDEVRVLVVGQDPYPTPGHAIGLSFAVAPHVHPLPKSLVNIHRELVDDLGVPPPSNGDLTPWAEQGVMLLNRSLTVTPGSPSSHRGKGWEAVTDRAIEVLAGRDGPLVAILWGADARRLAPALGRERCIESVHPSPLSAYKGFFGSRPFSRTNDLLVRQGAAPIDWRLP
ncbi:uracil-DNA glycosylase [Janibacter cremeus]|uniref:uracil-DNA glycosylase n=1 Tax=Janibacter cremeus TaxID=1285192 RepID=UPI0023F81B44|nr:uracil-DNA glycosylase [Janibacter cremeus]WEV77756.1 uracil-DNA glycosylase [Janibacter cremeus]